MLNKYKKKDVYIHQFNAASSRSLIPLSAGLLKSYALSIPTIRDNYNIHLEIIRSLPDKIVRKYNSPPILAFSTYFWNFNQSIQVAKLAKYVFPEALIIFGGPMVPVNNSDIEIFLSQYQFVDIVVAGEGEKAFSEILLTLINGNKLCNINGVSYRDKNNEIVCNGRAASITDFSEFPSPFLDGVFDDLLKQFRDVFTGVLLETNRGCPFSCSFCYWGGVDKKIVKFPINRVLAELDWISLNKFDFISGVDANFGILERDYAIAKHMATLNNRTGYPKYLSINWTKNSTEKIFNVVDVLRKSKIKFMLTISMQSHNTETLHAVKRENVNVENFDKILQESLKRGIDVYSELILGLPLETYQTFVDGIRKVLLPALNYHFNLYYFYLIPGSAMSRPEYIKKYKIETRRCFVSFERTVSENDSVPEFEDIVVATSTMSKKDWKKSFTFGYFAKTLYGYRLTFFIFNYLNREKNIDLIELLEFIISTCFENQNFRVISNALKLLEDLENSIINSGNELVKIKNIETCLHPEVATLVSLLSEKKQFYRELFECLDSFLGQRGFNISRKMYKELFVYQFCIIPSWKSKNQFNIKFDFNIIGYLNNGTYMQQCPTFLIFGNGKTFSSVDEFLSNQIYGGLKFSLSKVEVMSNKEEQITEFFKADNVFEDLIVSNNEK